MIWLIGGTFGSACGALCIWLTVRIVNMDERERREFFELARLWAAILFIFAVAGVTAMLRIFMPRH